MVWADWLASVWAVLLANPQKGGRVRAVGCRLWP